MTIAPTAPTAFDIGRVSSPLDASARAVTADDDGRAGLLVVAIHPGRDDRRVVSHADAGTVRAAVSVAVAAGNDRVWRDSPGDVVTEHPVASLPEVVRSAASASGLTSVHVGVVRRGVDVHCVAMWFTDDEHASDHAEWRTHVTMQLSAATERELVFEEAARAVRDASTTELECDDTFHFDPDDPDLDPLTGLANADCFERTLDAYELDEATLLLVDLDGFSDFVETYGESAGDALLRETAARLRRVCRRGDVVARIGDDEFAILLDDTDRATGLEVSKRLLEAIAQPLPEHIAPAGVTASLGLAHEFGLLDMAELLESAGDAVATSKRTGPGRIVIAA